MTVEQIQFWQTIGVWLTFFGAMWIGYAQHSISKRMGNMQDAVEIYATAAVKQIVDKDGKPISQTPALHIQNVGTRHVYFDRYNFNGRIYELNGQVRPSTYSQAENNFYWVELPTNGEQHASVILDYHDVDGRKWQSKMIADLDDSGFWKVSTFPRESLR